MSLVLSIIALICFMCVAIFFPRGTLDVNNFHFVGKLNRRIEIKKPFRIFFYGKYDKGITIPELVYQIIGYLIALVSIVLLAVIWGCSGDEEKAFKVAMLVNLVSPFVAYLILAVIFRIIEKILKK